MRKIHLKNCQKVILMAVVMFGLYFEQLICSSRTDSDRCCKKTLKENR